MTAGKYWFLTSTEYFWIDKYYNTYKPQISWLCLKLWVINFFRQFESLGVSIRPPQKRKHSCGSTVFGNQNYFPGMQTGKHILRKQIRNVHVLFLGMFIYCSSETICFFFPQLCFLVCEGVTRHWIVPLSRHLSPIVYCQDTILFL